jgi:hypothetical protein
MISEAALPSAAVIPSLLIDAIDWAVTLLVLRMKPAAITVIIVFIMWGFFVWYIVFTDSAKRAKPLLVKGFSKIALSGNSGLWKKGSVFFQNVYKKGLSGFIQGFCRSPVLVFSYKKQLPGMFLLWFIFLSLSIQYR